MIIMLTCSVSVNRTLKPILKMSHTLNAAIKITPHVFFKVTVIAIVVQNTAVKLTVTSTLSIALIISLMLPFVVSRATCGGCSPTYVGQCLHSCVVSNRWQQSCGASECRNDCMEMCGFPWEQQGTGICIFWNAPEAHFADW